MPITPDQTQPGAGELRTDSSGTEPRGAGRVPHRHTGSLARDSSSIAFSGERSSSRLRPVSSPALHETVSPDRQTSSAGDPKHKLSRAEFNTTMAHFYRGEVQRSNTWRTRLDTTTYWAVLTAGATLSFTFSSPLSPHFVIPINSILVTVFLVMEARRYRYYEIWASRVRVIETGYLAPMLAPGNVPQDEDWASHLANDLLTPNFTISVWEAIGRRLRRNYLWIFLLLALSWNLKVYLHPVAADSFQLFLQRATVGLVPGWIVFIIGFIFNVAIFSFALFTIRLREATGEVLPRHQFSLHPLQRMSSWTRAAATSGGQATVRRARRARQRLRGGVSGEFRKIDVTQTPDRRAQTSETSDRVIK
jgi:uncharacterized membrane protein